MLLPSWAPLSCDPCFCTRLVTVFVQGWLFWCHPCAPYVHSRCPQPYFSAQGWRVFNQPCARAQVMGIFRPSSTGPSSWRKRQKHRNGRFCVARVSTGNARCTEMAFFVSLAFPLCKTRQYPARARAAVSATKEVSAPISIICVSRWKGNPPGGLRSVMPGLTGHLLHSGPSPYPCAGVHKPPEGYPFLRLFSRNINRKMRVR